MVPLTFQQHGNNDRQQHHRLVEVARCRRLTERHHFALQDRHVSLQRRPAFSRPTPADVRAQEADGDPLSGDEFQRHHGQYLSSSMTTTDRPPQVLTRGFSRFAHAAVSQSRKAGLPFTTRAFRPSTTMRSRPAEPMVYPNENDTLTAIHLRRGRPDRPNRNGSLVQNSRQRSPRMTIPPPPPANGNGVWVQATQLTASPVDRPAHTRTSGVLITTTFPASGTAKIRGTAARSVLRADERGGSDFHRRVFPTLPATGRHWSAMSARRAPSSHACLCPIPQRTAPWWAAVT